MSSSLLIVITGVVAIVVTSAAYYLITPLFLEVQQNPSAACQANPNCTAIFDRQYDVWFLLFEMFLGGIFLSMYIRSVRRDAVETMEGF